MRAVLVLFLSVPMALAGCSDATVDSTDSPTGDPMETDAQPALPAPSWANQTLEGTFVGFSTPVVSGNPLVLVGDGYGTHAFSVPEGAQVLEVSVHLVSPVEEVMLRLIPPGCRGACTHDVVTTGGMATLSVEAPGKGDWNSIMFHQDLGAGATPYHLYVGILA